MAKQIRIENVFKVFGDQPKQALDLVRQGLSKQQILERTGQSIGVFDADFTIEAGEIFVVMGLSGSGKSTLVRMLNRLIEPTSGRIVVDGQDINGLNDQDLRALRRKDISMVFQSFALMPHMSVLDNTAFGLEMAGVDKGARQKAAQEALEQVGLGAWGASYPDELSGGMQQRVGLARALASDPSILLMDEAFSALDPIIRTEMQSELLRLQESKRRTIVFISHDLDEAMRIGDRIAIMKDGQVIQVGTPDEILRSPANDYVRSFIKGVDAAAVFKASDIARQALTIVSEHNDRGCRAALRLIEDSDRDHAYVLNARRRLLGVVSAQSLRDALHGREGMLGLQHAFIDNVVPIDAATPVADLFGPMASAPCPLPVLAEDRKFLGVISRTTMMRFLDRDTPPVPPPQPVQPPVTLNPMFPTGDADTPAMLHEHSDAPATDKENKHE
ncbi:glycine betaine/L-proline ABC transporter ATP-binding protein ProV [Comamonas aquatica]|uniref:Quaternary amine transport ATP-binding protein n=1 Tax=Comamonas aquatica TaxID=225991 RepID=A0AA35D479_9BURK|nr:glycine betaine/L-proline ABC transporter ATP-binding protein ProV [Comamonas aquatica]CAB5659591.1 Glycine betaine/L-proline transport ATP-binding protein ProV [Comamonas aquatica]CAB5675164.1 Glycine betaine/L-proline transport ATP-binding protein ProV [Comamonas aquatica]CAC9208984.1 Glycine betaine/L-proline transport ATP-binding protein ProV [Comamonas aquatica]CAC9686871.1 Glycine betaine/L-proline transport ATP-binding protein ProV [Comamonas aquatica]